MTTDATSDPNDGVSVDGTGQNQSDVFRGESHAAESRRGSTEKGISARSVPAFVAGEELADLAEFDSRIVVMTADLASPIDSLTSRHVIPTDSSTWVSPRKT